MLHTLRDEWCHAGHMANGDSNLSSLTTNICLTRVLDARLVVRRRQQSVPMRYPYTE